MYGQDNDATNNIALEAIHDAAQAGNVTEPEADETAIPNESTAVISAATIRVDDILAATSPWLSPSDLARIVVDDWHDPKLRRAVRPSTAQGIEYNPGTKTAQYMDDAKSADKTTSGAQQDLEQWLVNHPMVNELSADFVAQMTIAAANKGRGLNDDDRRLCIDYTWHLIATHPEQENYPSHAEYEDRLAKWQQEKIQKIEILSIDVDRYQRAKMTGQSRFNDRSVIEKAYEYRLRQENIRHYELEPFNGHTPYTDVAICKFAPAEVTEAQRLELSQSLGAQLEADKISRACEQNKFATKAQMRQPNPNSKVESPGNTKEERFLKERAARRKKFLTLIATIVIAGLTIAAVATGGLIGAFMMKSAIAVIATVAVAVLAAVVVAPAIKSKVMPKPTTDPKLVKCMEQVRARQASRAATNPEEQNTINAPQESRAIGSLATETKDAAQQERLGQQSTGFRDKLTQRTSSKSEFEHGDDAQQAEQGSRKYSQSIRKSSPADMEARPTSFTQRQQVGQDLENDDNYMTKF